MVGNKKPPPAQLAARGLRVDAGTLYAPSTNALTKYYRHPAGLHSSTVVSAQVRRQIPRGDDSDGSTTAPGESRANQIRVFMVARGDLHKAAVRDGKWMANEMMQGWLPIRRPNHPPHNLW
jgi:hypothetical protein